MSASRKVGKKGREAAPRRPKSRKTLKDLRKLLAASAKPANSGIDSVDQKAAPSITCSQCGSGLAPGEVFEHRGSQLCHLHFQEQKVGRCGRCGEIIVGEHLQAMGTVWDVDCFSCNRCSRQLTASSFHPHAGQPYCSAMCAGVAEKSEQDRKFWELRDTLDAQQPKPKLVAGIDFGTARSGWALAKFDEKSPPQKKKEVFFDPDAEQTRTCVLMDSKGEAVAFGNDARRQFQDMDEDEVKSYMYFDQFKMKLHDNHAAGSLTLTASNGRTVPAQQVFSASINLIKRQVMAEYQKVVPLAFEVQPHEIHWVLTVPAIWTPAAKQLMRAAMTDCGIVNHRLDVALEPESAAIRCMENSQDGTDLKTGMSFMILDCGGGTVDITVSEVLGIKPLSLREKTHPHGGPWGSTYIDAEFRKFLDRLFCHPGFMRGLELSDPVMYSELMDKFESAKHGFNGGNKYRNVLLPKGFAQYVSRVTGQGVQEWVKGFEGGRSALHYGKSSGALKLGTATMASFFDAVLNPTVQEVKGILQNHHVDFIFLVGGLGSSGVVKERIQKEFHDPPRRMVVCPPRPEWAVVTGAVLYGLDTSVIKGRVMKECYYVEACMPFNPAVHPVSRVHKLVRDGRQVDYVDVLAVWVKKDDRVSPRDVVHRTYLPAADGMTQMPIKIMSSTTLKTYPDEPGVRERAMIVVDLSGTAGNLDRQVDVHVVFGSSQIQVYATNTTTGEEQNVSVDFNAPSS